MKLHQQRVILCGFAALVFMAACKPDDEEEQNNGGASFQTTPYTLEIPANMPDMPIPSDNPMTLEGVTLGRFLFYEERLSGNNSMSCASCHAPQFAFSDNGNQFSVGIDGTAGNRTSMALVNLGWEQRFFWDGRALSLEEQILQPVENVIEMHDTWPNVVGKLQADDGYVELFCDAFGTTTIDKYKAAKAIAQFLRTMISGNSRFDQFQRGEITPTIDEQFGILLTQQEGGDPAAGLGGQWGADCFHCHPHAGALFTDGIMRNNGLDSTFTDLGLGGVTGLPQDMGVFKVPTLKNVALSAPYMHDGRFATLEEVIDHYDSGGHPSPTVSPFMKFTQGGLQLTPEKKTQLLAFLNMLTDMDFVNNPEFQDPGTP